MELVDTHCHLDFPIFDFDRKTVIQRSLGSGIVKFIIPSVTSDQWQSLVFEYAENRNFAVAIGCHPCFLSTYKSELIEEIDSNILNHRGVVAIGETGLDYFIDNFDEKLQNMAFQNQIDLARSANLPLILHVRKAHDQVSKLLRQRKFSFGGVVHCYSGSLQQAQAYLKLGFKLGIGGVVTYSRSLRLHKIVKELPLDSFVLETDAPDIPPMGKENQRNSPEYLPEIFRAFSRLRPESEPTIANQLMNNTKDCFPKLII